MDADTLPMPGIDVMAPEVAPAPEPQETHLDNLD